MSRTERLNPATKIVVKTKPRPPCRATASSSHMGGRATQQDACQIWENPAIGVTFVVLCDGVGGSRSGAEASAVVIQTAGQLWSDRGGVFSDPKRDLFSLASVARDRIADLAVAGEKRAPASTIVALYLTATEAHWIHAGDSRLYHFRNSEVMSRTRDHSVVQILVDQGEVREEEMGNHPDQGRLLQSLGSQEYRDPAYGFAAVGLTDAFVLCTDGFWERTPPAVMASIFMSGPPNIAADLRKIVDRAVRANGPSGDNVTVAIVAPLTRPPDSRPGLHLKKFHLYLIAAAVVLALAAIAIFKGWGGGQSTSGNQDPAGKATLVPAKPTLVAPSVTPAPPASADPHSPSPKPAIHTEPDTNDAANPPLQPPQTPDSVTPVQNPSAPGDLTTFPAAPAGRLKPGATPLPSTPAATPGLLKPFLESKRPEAPNGKKNE